VTQNQPPKPAATGLQVRCFSVLGSTANLHSLSTSVPSFILDVSLLLGKLFRNAIQNQTSLELTHQFKFLIKCGVTSLPASLAALSLLPTEPTVIPTSIKHDSPVYVPDLKGLCSALDASVRTLTFFSEIAPSSLQHTEPSLARQAPAAKFYLQWEQLALVARLQPAERLSAPSSISYHSKQWPLSVSKGQKARKTTPSR
jgi:hypothetical protein